jgi:hypothetical protein
MIALIVMLPSNCGCGDFSAISYRYMVAALEVLVGWTQEGLPWPRRLEHSRIYPGKQP